ncbi:hypothetical protein CUR86_18220 [Salinicola acroporae]|uniref:DUF1203 domain-containing protein n=2 Tax=Salinicola acroporae TaxID=1541440 RepID=A0ABT6IAW7_9GAMM|nr:hypothetical protein [Salinicola acroporae]
MHHPVDSPYRATGPVFVGEGATRRVYRGGGVPPSLAKRSLSLRAYDAKGFLSAATLCHGSDVSTEIDALLEDERTDSLHVHYSAPGCFACLVERQ